jgi:hypothetical protein
MKVDLEPLPYQMAFGMIRWCIENDIDRNNCLRLLEASAENPTPPVIWELEIPDKYLTMFLLKWL